MSNFSQLPSWVSYSQALAVPIIAVTVAAFGTWIAARQMLIANEKLRLDAFDRQYERRVAVYEATRKILEGVFNKEKELSENDIRAYGLHALDAKFLFDESLYGYLREVRQRIDAWKFAKHRAEASPAGDEKEEFQRIMNDNLRWITQEGDEQNGFATRFTPFLIHKEAGRPWWLRWP